MENGKILALDTVQIQHRFDKYAYVIILDFQVAKSLLSISSPRKIIKESKWFYGESGLDEQSSSVDLLHGGRIAILLVDRKLSGQVQRQKYMEYLEDTSSQAEIFLHGIKNLLLLQFKPFNIPETNGLSHNIGKLERGTRFMQSAPFILLLRDMLTRDDTCISLLLVVHTALRKLTLS